MRHFVEKLKAEGKLVQIKKPVSKRLEASGILKELDGQAVYFEKIKESEFPVVGNLCSNRDLVASALGTTAGQLVKKMMNAIDKPTEPAQTNNPACREVVEETVDLDKYPILYHCNGDGGNYASSSIVFARDAEHGMNASFHRMMQIGKNKFAVRILERHLHEFIKRAGGKLDVAVCIGSPVSMMIGGGTSIGIGVSELNVANSLAPIEISRAKTMDVDIPATAEFVFEGTIDSAELHEEGKFVDLTGTHDIIRKQPVFTVKRITHRRNPVWQALLPGANEHRTLMGMPREPTIFREVGKVCDCLDVYLSTGGCSWLHGIVQIRKKNDDDGKKAIEAAFKGHASMKNVVVVDEDINIRDAADVEWAICTRVQAPQDVVLKEKQKGSSLDPSANPETRETSKLGIDATLDLNRKQKFLRVEFPKVDVKKYL